MAAEPEVIRPKRRRRWILAVCGLVALTLAVVVAAPPLYLSSPAGRRYLLQRSDRSLAPSQLKVESFHFSWFGPTRMTGLVLLNSKGKTLVDAPLARWDRNLWQVLFDPLHRGKLDLQSTSDRRATLIIRHTADGKIDLYETLKPVLKGDPRTDVSIRVRDGRIQVEDPGFKQPWTGRIDAISLHLASIPRPVSWEFSIAGTNGETLKSQGTVEHPKRTPSGEIASIPTLAATFTVDSWPVALSREGVSVQGAVASKIALGFAGGRWKTTGDLTGSNFKIDGKPLAGDSLALSHLRGAWDVSLADNFTDTKIKSIYVNIPMGGFSIEGPIPPAPGSTSVVEADVDLAPLVAQLPHVFRTSEQHALNAGKLRVKATAKGKAKAPASWDVRADLTDFAATVNGERVALENAATLRGRLAPADAKGRLPLDLRLEMGDNPWLDGPLTLDVDGGYTSKTDRLELTDATLETGEGDVSLSGVIDRLTTRRDTDLNAQWTPDWPAINAIVRRRIEPKASLDGGPITLHLVGSLARISLDEIPKELDARIQIPIKYADVYGMKVGAVNIAGQLEKGNLAIAPIETTLNGGAVHLEPVINRDPTGDGFTVVLGEESTIDDAQINDEVSHRVLSFLVPFMANATRANGMLDVQLSHAEFPIGSTAGRKTLVEGEVVFKDVQFSPGPLMEDLFANLGPLGRNVRPSVLQLNHPVLLSIHDGKVHQHGLAFPLGNVSEIAVDGTVGFDKSIDLKVTLPITTAMLGGPNPLDGKFGGDLTRLTLPITGTLSKPKIDPDAFKLGMQQTGRDLFQGAGILQGVDGLIQLFNRPRDPNAPPPLTAQERREQRLEKKRERQMRRQMRRNGGILP